MADGWDLFVRGLFSVNSQSTGAGRVSTNTVLSLVSSCSAGASVSGAGSAAQVCQTSTSTELITTTLAGTNAVYTSYIPTTLTLLSTAPAQTNSVCVTAQSTTTTTTMTTTTPSPSSTTPSSTSTTPSATPSSTTTTPTATATSNQTIPSSVLTTTAPSSSSATSSGFQTITSYSTLLVTTTGADGSASVATTSSPIAGLQSGKQGGSGSSHSSTGAIAGGVVGGVAGLALLAGVVLLLKRKGFFRKDADEHFTDDMWAPQAHSPGLAGFGTGAAAGAAGAGAAAGAGGVRSRRGHGDDEDEVADHSHNSAEGMMMSEKPFDRETSWYSGDQHAPLATSNTAGGYYPQPTSSHGHSLYPSSADGLAAMGLAGVGAGGSAGHHQGVGSSSGSHGPDPMYYGRSPSATGHPDYYGNAYPAYPPPARSPTPGNELNSSGFARNPSYDRLNQGSPGPLALEDPGHLGLDFSSGAVPTHDAYGGLSADEAAPALGASDEGHLSDLAHPEPSYVRPANARHNSADSFTGPSQFLGARVANGDEAR